MLRFYQIYTDYFVGYIAQEASLKENVNIESVTANEFAQQGAAAGVCRCLNDSGTKRGNLLRLRVFRQTARNDSHDVSPPNRVLGVRDAVWYSSDIASCINMVWIDSYSGTGVHWADRQLSPNRMETDDYPGI